MPWAGGWSSQAELSPNTHTQTHSIDTHTHMLAGAHIAEPVGSGREGTQGGATAGLDCGLGQGGQGTGGRAAYQFSRTKFSHGIWVLHRHPKSIGCAYWLGFGRAEGKMRLDLSLTYGGERRGCARHKHPRILFVERSLYGPICQSTLDRTVCGLVQGAWTCWGTCYERCGVLLSVYFSRNILYFLVFRDVRSTLDHFVCRWRYLLEQFYTKSWIWHFYSRWQSAETILLSNIFLGFHPPIPPTSLSIPLFAKPVAYVCCAISTTTRGTSFTHPWIGHWPVPSMITVSSPTSTQRTPSHARK